MTTNKTTFKKMRKHVQETENLFSTLKIEASYIELKVFDSMNDLIKESIQNPSFHKAIEYEMFKPVFGWNMASIEGMIYMTKKNSTHCIYIEAELQN